MVKFILEIDVEIKSDFEPAEKERLKEYIRLFDSSCTVAYAHHGTTWYMHCTDKLTPDVKERICADIERGLYDDALIDEAWISIGVPQGTHTDEFMTDQLDALRWLDMRGVAHVMAGADVILPDHPWIEITI